MFCGTPATDDPTIDYLLGIASTPDQHAFDDIPKLQYEVLRLIHAREEAFLRQLIAVLYVMEGE